MSKAVKKRKATGEDVMKQSIFETTVRVIKTYEPTETRVDRVVKATEMATGTLYNYFKDKDVLLLHGINTLFDLSTMRDFAQCPKRDVSPNKNENLTTTLKGVE